MLAISDCDAYAMTPRDGGCSTAMRPSAEAPNRCTIVAGAGKGWPSGYRTSDKVLRYSTVHVMDWFYWEI